LSTSLGSALNIWLAGCRSAGSAILAADPAGDLWAAAKHLDAYPEAIRTCARVGGDIDTTAAITGGIVAAYTGTEGIPADWLAARELLPTWLNET